MLNTVEVINSYVAVFKAYVLIWAPSGRFHFGFLIKIVWYFSYARCEGEYLATETGILGIFHDIIKMVKSPYFR
jgi:hypothetical protein